MHPLALRLLALCALGVLAPAQDWTNSGGNAGRNGQSQEYGPLTAQVAWSGSRSSIIAWQPATAGSRAFLVRQSGFPPGGEPNGSPVVCHDLTSGAELWAVHLPFNAGDWTTWVLGTSNGLVYASRAGNGASVKAKVYALDQATGAVAWVSQDLIDAGAYDGVVFAPDGDLIVASFRDIWRIEASDGKTTWRAPRTGSVSGNCGGALLGSAFYVADAAAGGHVLVRFDLTTGARQYASAVMPGFTLQSTPMVGPDGTVYLPRTQNNPAVDYFYAWNDTGSGFVQRWSVPAASSAGAEHGVGTDGSVYMVQPGQTLARLDPATGAVRSTFPGLGYATTRFAIDADGRLYVSNGGFGTGRLYAFDPDLTLRWSVAVPNVNIGGPALGQGGTLLIAGIGSNVIAYRTPSPWSDPGGGIAGASGLPVLAGRGTLTAGNAVTLLLSNALPGALSSLVVGQSALNLPLLGGVLVPAPDAVVTGLPIDAQGRVALTFSWPAGVPAGTSLWLQHWYLDAAAVQGVAASNGLRAIAP